MEVKCQEVNHSNLCSMATKHGQKNRYCKFRMMMTFMEVKKVNRGLKDQPKKSGIIPSVFMKIDLVWWHILLPIILVPTDN